MIDDEEPRVVYTDHDAFVCEWLRDLVAHGDLPRGEVIERDVRELGHEELGSVRHVHLFAGIGGWALAAQRAGWPREWPLWTLSCPCQPFSNAGRRRGEADGRDLWPAVLPLVDQCRPPVLAGEQVAGRAGDRWLARAKRDCEARAYAFASATLPACAVGAPHRRERHYWCAVHPDRVVEDLPRERRGRPLAQRPRDRNGAPDEHREPDTRRGAVGDGDRPGRARRHTRRSDDDAHGVPSDPWSPSTLVLCRSPGRAPVWRRAPLGTLRGMADGVPPWMEPIRVRAKGEAYRKKVIEAYGNAIVPQVGEWFLRWLREALEEGPGEEGEEGRP